MTSQRDWLTLHEVADELQLNPETIRRYCVTGEFPHARKFGISWRVHRSDLEPSDVTPLIAPPSRRSLAQQRRTA
ncbi:helix-turn-helix domain-containing protein [Brachybacterium halotolerans subsp. kimchii]|uniref:helix-turn-helix domain-containing protein n=1 Tax=Brachybacterium halotolerans TaxID=2795215 RepID=UPI001E5CBA5A|nr:helix-turn-helix domain-containing protein [Brachybacterium halotolerans]UEJ83955.1 helix-turn-helix domain-containing protein [Brachybacterium halotolerans subsp. kimchii]